MKKTVRSSLEGNFDSGRCKTYKDLKRIDKSQDYWESKFIKTDEKSTKNGFFDLKFKFLLSRNTWN